MSKRKRRWEAKSRQDKEERAINRELADANRGIVGDTNEQIAKELEEEAKNQKTRSSQTEKPRIYVLDTNVILSCVDILYDKDDELWREPLEFKPNLDNSTLIIPEIVFNELDHINKTDRSINGIIAGKAIGRLMKFFQNSGRNVGDITDMKTLVSTGWHNQKISILPLEKDFRKYLPIAPNEQDNDGWIIVTALKATLLHEGVTDFGTMNFAERNNLSREVSLLTNDRQMISKADLYGVHTKRYSFKKRPAFTGCRELTVPAKMFNQFFHDESLSQEDFLAYLPDEEPLADNEFVIMHPEGDKYPNQYFTVGLPCLNVARFNKSNNALWMLRSMKYEGETPVNAGIGAYYDALNDDKIKQIVVTGKAGTGKTYSAIVHGIKAVKKGKYRRIIVIPSQSAKNPLGSLPGKEAEKMEPMVAFVKDAIENWLESTPEFQKKRDELRRFGDRDVERDPEESYDHEKPRKKKKDSSGDFFPSKEDKKQFENESKMTYNDFLKARVKYIYDRYFEALPYEMAQGRTFDDSIIILDEFQRTSVDDSATLLTRVGKNSKLIVSGDVDQIHDSTPEKRMRNGLTRAAILFFDKDSSAFIHLTENLRSDTAAIATEDNREALMRLGLWA